MKKPDKAATFAVSEPPPGGAKWPVVLILVAVLGVALGAGYWFGIRKPTQTENSPTVTSTPKPTDTPPSPPAASDAEAAKLWNDAEAAFNQQRGKDAEALYNALLMKFPQSETAKKNAAKIKERLAALKTSAAANQPGLSASIYNGREFEAKDLLVSRIDAKVDFDWGDEAPAPDTPADNFCIRWEGFVKADAAGTYVFNVESDDGNRLWIDDKQIIDDWHDHGPQKATGQIQLEPGLHKVRLEFYENGGGAMCRFTWALAGSFEEQIVPPEALFHNPAQQPKGSPHTGDRF